MSLTILADDLPGACDSGALFAGKSAVPLTIWPRPLTPAADAPVRVVDTETRSSEPADAAALVSAVVGAAGDTTWFKTIDGTLRGPIGAEVDALLRATGTRSAVFCPAFPAQGRVVLDRTLFVDGTPVAETALAGDPGFPRAATSSVIDLVRRQLDRPIAWIPIEQLRAGTEALAARLTRLAGTVAVADTETDADLDALVEAALLADVPGLLVGTPGLARALAARLGLLVPCIGLPRGDRWLVVGDGAHAATRRQIAAARAAGLRVIATPDLAATAADAARLLRAETFDVLAVTGGRAMLALCDTLGAERLDLVGAPRPGWALGHLRAPGIPALRVLLETGIGGPVDALVELAEATR
ncbi:MAG: four-carbon acid sugar kinase family protein [Candidatus Rokubacteria bacterium]|nr:four-carbon acid sugar kinase family protein [Candidatus Rokubacteria bacterium]